MKKLELTEIIFKNADTVLELSVGIKLCARQVILSTDHVNYYS